MSHQTKKEAIMAEDLQNVLLAIQWMQRYQTNPSATSTPKMTTTFLNLTTSARPNHSLIFA
jgi:hypothetical protein